jgi:hypothetical protein
MPWRIDISGILQRPRIIRRITLAWLLLVVLGSLHASSLFEVVEILRPARLRLAVASWHHAGLRAAVESLNPARLLVAVGPLHPVEPGPVVDLHRGIHWLAFGGAAFLLLLLSRNRRQEILSVIATCLLGLSLEYLQHLIYHIEIEWFDVRDDALAALVALALYGLAGTCKAAFRATRRAAKSETVIRTEAALIEPGLPGCPRP